jgi:hypothetical protein
MVVDVITDEAPQARDAIRLCGSTARGAIKENTGTPRQRHRGINRIPAFSRM